MILAQHNSVDWGLGTALRNYKVNKKSSPWALIIMFNFQPKNDHEVIFDFIKMFW